MPSEFDELINDLLYCLAIAADDGLDFAAVSQHVEDFYHAKYGNVDVSKDVEHEALLFSDEPPDVRPTVDEAFLQNIWDLLLKHKDVTSRIDLVSETGGSDSRLVATTERTWQAIAGHGVDLKRIKKTEFVLLKLIAKHGVHGIVQPDLVKISGQDKRSVPKRTDALAANGYITKTTIIAVGTRTSLLKLIKFADEADGLIVTKQPDGRTIVHYDYWFDTLCDMLKQQGGVVTLDDVRLRLDIHSPCQEARALNRCIRRLMEAKFVERIKARMIDVPGNDEGRAVNSLRMLRDPTDEDRAVFKQYATTVLKNGRKAKLADNSNHLAQDDASEDDLDDGYAVDVNRTEGETSDYTALTRIAPQWTPGIPIPNLLYDMIDKAGAAGLATMDVHLRAMGSAWRRPIDELLIRLCDQWKTSQPPHLRHLAILKDTAMNRRTHYFLYRTRPAFDEAVANGSTFWEAIDAAAVATDDKAEHPNDSFANEPSTLDSWGFPIVDPDLLAGRQDGTASLAVSERSIKATGRTAGSTGLSVKRKRSDMSVDDSPRPSKFTAHSIDHLASNDRTEAENEEEADAELQTPEQVAGESSTAGSLNDVREIQAGSREVLIDNPPMLAPSIMCAINPAGALQMKIEQLQHVGRPRKALIAVLRFPALQRLPWFVETTCQELQTPKRKRMNTSTSSTPVKRVKHGHVKITRRFSQSKPSDKLAEHNGSLDEAHPNVQQSIDESLNQEAVHLSTGNNSLADTAGHYTAHNTTLPEAKTPELDNGNMEKSVVTAKPSGAVALRRSKAILDIVRKCGGVYPGNREIFLPMSTLYNTKTSVLDIATIDNAVKSLLQTGKLKKIVFQHYNSRNLLLQKAILAEPHIAPGDDVVQNMQTKIKEMKDGRKYYPAFEGFEPPASSLNNGFRPPEEPQKQSEVLPVVRRTEQGLEFLAKRSREALAKQQAEGSPARPKRVKIAKRIVVDSDEDSDEEEISEEQAQLSGKFEAADYEPSFTHAHHPYPAFRSIYPRKAFESSFRPRAQEPSRNGISAKQHIDLPWYEMAITSRPQQQQSGGLLAFASTRFSDLMMCPAQRFHPASGTFATSAISDGSTISWTGGRSLYRYIHYGWVDPEENDEPRPRVRLFPRLESLSSQLFNTRLNSNVLRSLRNPTGVLRVTRSMDTREPLQQLSNNSPSSASQDAVRETDKTAKRRVVKTAVSNEPVVTLVKKRDRRSPKLFQENDRLASAVALYRAVMGGLDQRCNWGVIAHMLSFKYEPDFLRRRWDAMKNAREETVRGIMELIYKPFLEAYEQGEVPTIDFTQLANTDWVAMLKWLERSVLAPGGLLNERSYDLPQEVDAFHAAYAVVEPNSYWEWSRDSWFTNPVEKSRKDIAHEFVYGMPLPGHARAVQPKQEADNLVLRTLIRAVAVTARENYTPAAAAQKLQGYENVSLVCDEMLANKTLRHVNKGRSLPGRGYEIHDVTWSAFRRWPGKDSEWQYLREVAKARLSIADTLEHEGSMLLNYEASDFEIVVLVNMVRQGLLKITSQLPARNDDFEAPFPKLSAWGYAGYSYNAKTLDRERLRFPLLLEKTEAYSVKHGLVPGVPVPSRPAANDGRIAIWVDINGEVVPDVWDLVLRSVLHIVVYRTGVTIAAIEEAHGQRLSTWEIELVLRWMHQSKIVEPYGPGVLERGEWTGGWKVSQWWYCAYSPDMLVWSSSA